MSRHTESGLAALLPTYPEKELKRMHNSKENLVTFFKGRYTCFNDMKEHEERVYLTTLNDLNAIQIELLRREQDYSCKTLEELESLQTEVYQKLRDLENTYEEIRQTSSEDNLRGLFQEIKKQDDLLSALIVEFRLRNRQ